LPDYFTHNPYYVKSKRRKEKAAGAFKTAVRQLLPGQRLALL